MSEDALAEPVSILLTLGQPKDTPDPAWLDYRSLGIDAQHTPDLIRIAVDPNLLNITDEDDPQAWAPVHAWRALAQLKSCEAIAPLIRLFHEIQDNDWVIEEMPDVFALIGPAAFDDLALYLRTQSYPAYARMVAATSLMQMALAHPHLREQSIEALAEQLTAFRTNTPGMNGVLIANLVELDAVEKTELIHQTFVESKVDRFISGDWRDIKKRLRSRTPTNPNQ